MYVKLVLAFVVLCAVILQLKCEKNPSERTYMDGYTRIKRGKYYTSPPRIFYNRPPVSHPVKGLFSYTPPPNYMADNGGPPGSPYPGPPSSYPRPSKVSKRPTNEGLSEEDLYNMVKYLSKHDLDKIIDLAGGRDGERYSKNSFDKDTEYRSSKDDNKSSRTSLYDVDTDTYSDKLLRDDESKLLKELVQEIDSDPKYTNFQDSKPVNVEYSKPIKSYANYVTQPTPPEAYFSKFQNSNNIYDTAALAAEESMLKNQIAYLQSQINNGVVYTDSKAMPEEPLPKPMNLREEQDYDVSYTNNVPTVVKAEPSSSYKLENFGDLPLMNYNSKLDSLSSYHVPHYTVTSSSKPSSPPAYFPPPSLSLPYGSKVPSVEAAPPPSAAKAQSDAHLKAVRIWSHKSTGTAYTLHNDGSLSLEKPGRPKGSYGYP